MADGKRIRILFFLNSTVRGGVEEVVLALVNQLDRTQFEIHLAAPPQLLNAYGSALPRDEISLLPLHLSSWRQFGRASALFRYLRERRIQIVNSHLFYATLFAAPIAWLAGVPVVIETTHGPEAWRSTWWKRKGWVDRFIERFVTLNIAVSEANRRYLLETKKYPARKLRTVPNGRDLAPFDKVSPDELACLRRKLGLCESCRVVAVVARLDAQKGHEYLLRALPDVAARYPGLRVVLAGDGPLRADLERLTAELGLSGVVIFAGIQTGIAAIYRLAEFLILPSLYEGMPLTAIEAGAAARPLIATNVDGTTEVVVDGETGLLVAPRSPESIREAMLLLLESPEKAMRMGQAARRRVEERFTLERQIAETETLYTKALLPLNSENA